MTELIVKAPYDGELLAEFKWNSRSEIQSVLAVATQTFSRWRNSPAWERAELLSQISTELSDAKEDFA
jgi:acyl-CoA reductase-like NAD-dependent aldehyde dehydrogenase